MVPAAFRRHALRVATSVPIAMLVILNLVRDDELGSGKQVCGWAASGPCSGLDPEPRVFVVALRNLSQVFRIKCGTRGSSHCTPASLGLKRSRTSIHMLVCA